MAPWQIIPIRWGLTPARLRDAGMTVHGMPLGKPTRGDDIHDSYIGVLLAYFTQFQMRIALPSMPRPEGVLHIVR